MADKNRRYRVVGAQEVVFDDKIRKPGDEFSANEDEAQGLVQSGAIELASKAKQDDD